MATNISVRNSNYVDAGITDQFFIDRTFSVLGFTINGQNRQITLNEDLTDNEKDELQGDLFDAFSFVVTDVSTGGESENKSKARYRRVIDRCTRKRIRRGFEHPSASGDVYALDSDSQSRWNRLRLHRNNLTYPFRILEQDGRGGVNINDVAEMNTFFDDFADQMDLIEGEDTQAKQNINTAANATDARAEAVTWLELSGHCPALVEDLGA